MIGHEGADYGSGGSFRYFPQFDMSFTIMFNKQADKMENSHDAIIYVWCI
jgi:hypothetical protein